MKNKLVMLVIALFAAAFHSSYTQNQKSYTSSYTSEIPQYIRAPEPEPKSWSDTITSGFKSIGSGILTGLGVSYVLTEKLLSSLWSGIKALPGALEQAYKSTISALSSAFNTAVELSTQAKEFVIRATTPYLKQIGMWLGQFAEWSSEKITQAGQLAQQVAKYTEKEIIKPAVKTAVPYILSGIEKLGTLLSKTGQFLSWAATNIKSAGEAAAEAVWPYIVKVGTGIKFIAEVGFDLLKLGYKNILTPLGHRIAQAGNALLDLGSKALDVARVALTKASAVVKTQLLKFLDSSLEIIASIASYAQKAYAAAAHYSAIVGEKISNSVQALLGYGSALLDVVIALGNAAIEKGRPHAEWVWEKLSAFFWLLVEYGKTILSFGSDVLNVVVEKSKPKILAGAKKLQELGYQAYLQAEALYNYALEAGTPWVTWAIDKALAAYEYALEAGSNMLQAASEQYKSAQASVSKQLDSISAQLQVWREEVAKMRQQLDAKIKGIKVSLGFEVPQEAAPAA